MKIYISKERLEAIVKTLQAVNEEELQSSSVTKTRLEFWKLQGFFDYYLNLARLETNV